MAKITESDDTKRAVGDTIGFDPVPCRCHLREGHAVRLGTHICAQVLLLRPKAFRE